MPTTKKFSDFTNGSTIMEGDQVVGLRAGANYRFDFPGDGLLDANGNYFLKYITVGAGAVNYPELTNSATGSGVEYGVNGSDANIDWKATPKGTGLFDFDSSTAIQSPDGTTAQRPAATTAGRMRWNTDLVEMEYSDGTTWQQFASVTGSIPSIGSSTDNAVVRWNGAGGNAVQDSSVLISDADVVSGVTQLNVDNLRLDGDTISNTNASQPLDFNVNSGLRARIDTSGRWLFGTTTNATNSYINWTRPNGIMTLGQNMTDSTNKEANYCVPHYTNSEEPFGALRASVSSTNNIVDLGGGTANTNSATQIKVRAAATTTTTTGTEILRYTTSGWSMNSGTDFFSGYTKGSWTPTLTSGTVGDLSVAYSAQVGTYRELDDVILVDCRLVCTPTYTTASGQISITGAPFAVASSTFFSGSLTYQDADIIYPTSRNYITIRANAGSSAFQIVGHADSALSTVESITSLVSGNEIEIRFSLMYIRS